MMLHKRVRGGNGNMKKGANTEKQKWPFNEMLFVRRYLLVPIRGRFRSSGRALSNQICLTSF